MKKLTAFKDYLLDLKLVTPEKLEAYPENNQLDILTKPGKQGLEMAQVSYDAVFELNLVKASYTALVAIVSGWLAEHDQARNCQDVDKPEFEYELTEEGLVDVRLMIPFCESVCLVEKEQGPIHYAGKRWDTGDYDLWIAESGEVTDASTR